MRSILLSLALIHQACAGWYGSKRALDEGLDEARTHPLSPANGAILSQGSVVGSAVIVKEELVVTAAHVLAPELQRAGKQDLPLRYSFRYSGRDETVSYPLTQAYCFPEQDLAFLQTEKSFSKKDIAPVIPSHMYSELVSEYRAPNSNVPRVNAGHPALFFGCGHKIDAAYLEGKNKAEVDAVQLYDSPVNRFAIGHNFGEKALGQCALSQHFSQNFAWKENPFEAFYSWTSYKEPSSMSLLSSSLPGDSGGGMFVEKEEAFWLAGITSSGHVAYQWDRGDKRVGTRFVTLYVSDPLQTGESYLEKALQMSS
jgi:hypothetical protein